MLNNLDLQLLAEGDPAVLPQPAPVKTFSEEYVHDLREENKSHRIARKTAEDLVRKLIGLKEDEEIDDSKIAAFQSCQQKLITEALTKANERMLAAEIKSLDGYDTKLVSKLIDRSKIEIADDGSVKGLTEQLKDLEKEFPVIKKTVQSPPANPAPGPAVDEYKAAMEAWSKNPNSSELRMKVFALKQK